MKRVCAVGLLLLAACSADNNSVQNTTTVQTATTATQVYSPNGTTCGSFVNSGSGIIWTCGGQEGVTLTGVCDDGVTSWSVAESCPSAGATVILDACSGTLTLTSCGSVRQEVFTS